MRLSACTDEAAIAEDHFLADDVKIERLNESSVQVVTPAALVTFNMCEANYVSRLLVSRVYFMLGVQVKALLEQKKAEGVNPHEYANFGSLVVPEAGSTRDRAGSNESTHASPASNSGAHASAAQAASPPSGAGGLNFSPDSKQGQDDDLLHGELPHRGPLFDDGKDSAYPRGRDPRLAGRGLLPLAEREIDRCFDCASEGPGDDRKGAGAGSPNSRGPQGQKGFKPKMVCLKFECVC